MRFSDTDLQFVAKPQAPPQSEPFLPRKAGQSFYITSPLDTKKLMGNQGHIKQNLFAYFQGFSPAGCT